MVGAADARFFHEDTSFRVAPSIISKVWSIASQLGYGNYFINQRGGAITDDHLPVIQNLGIPMIDVIDYRMNSTGGGFFPHWHTTADNLSAIDKQTLRAVGQTVMHVIYHEQP
ncbi:Peptidase family M28 [compost metagenome]